MKKLLILIMLVMILVPTVTAASYTFKQNESVNFRFRCVDVNNSYCSTSTLLQINIDAPNGTNVINNQSMTSNETYFNYSLPTIDVGVYKVLIISPVANTSSEFSYEVTKTGIVSSDQRTNSVTRAVYFILVIAILLFIGFLFTNQSVPIMLTFFIMSLVFFIIALNFISLSLIDETVNPIIEQFFQNFTAIFWYILWFFAGLLIIMWAFTFLNTWILKKNMENLNRFG